MNVLDIFERGEQARAALAKSEATNPTPDGCGREEAAVNDPKEIYLSPPCCSDMVGEGRLWCENDEWPEGDCGTPEEHRPATRYVRADLTKPRVKELEWEDAPIGGDGMEVAYAPGGVGIVYLVRDSSVKKGCASLWKGFEYYGDYSSRAEAKAASQADFERRILSALEDDDG